MLNTFNPLEWIKSAQDWFAKTERSSGFRAYLIFLILVFGMAIVLLKEFNDVKYADITALGLITVPVLGFILLYCIKSFSDPDFCRSEEHVQRVMQIELEKMGSESHQLDGQVIEAQLAEGTEKEPRDSPPCSGSGEQEEIE